MLKKLVKTIVRLSIRNYQETRDPETRHRYAAMSSWVSILINGLLALLKGVFGLITGAVSLIADAFHTLSDVSTSVVIVLSFRMARKPSDTHHPFGHGRMEAVATLIVAVILIVAGIEILKSGIERTLHPKPFTASWTVIGIIGFTILVKQLLADFSMELGRMIDSQALKADSWHHRTDALSSVLVLAAFLGRRMGLSSLDGPAGVIVAGMIVYTGWRIAINGIDELLGKKPPAILVRQVKEAVRSFPDILDVHELIIHQYGQMRVMSFHIQVADNLSIKKVHELTEQVENKINDQFQTHVTIHCDPVNIHDPELNRIRAFVKEILQEWEGVTYHDLRIAGRKKSKRVFFDLVVNPEMKEADVDGLEQKLRDSLPDRFPYIESVVIEIEPKYVQ